MTVPIQAKSGAPGSAYVALAAGLTGLAVLIPLPLVAFMLALTGIGSALHARVMMRRDQHMAGTVPSLIGFIVSAIVVAASIPGLIAVAFWALAR